MADPIFWYPDKVFPEVKSSNSDVIAETISKESAAKICERHNQIIAQYEMKLGRCISALIWIAEQPKRIGLDSAFCEDKHKECWEKAYLALEKIGAK